MQRFNLGAILFLSMGVSACNGTSDTDASKPESTHSNQTAAEKKEAVVMNKPEKPTDSKRPSEKLKEKLRQAELPEVTESGVIVYKSLEGGFWGFDGDSGQKYMPYGIDKQYLRPGLRVKITGLIDDGVMTFQQYGKVLRVQEVTVLDDSKAGHAPNSY
ncbi:hypothetical protein OE749_18400 [Aestuariibacter sp. AA17]|uniref:Lipoprotein n=1 Tax=Fluctibacter corallii TaxID=2984329 RepID=A0ABT3ADF6_9ALTE|nr:hypothetical protein [Aestuariibacter sp. AA17]MCV2886670.1 hypothetical protein [Aestuariibacter sp. AA17]